MFVLLPHSKKVVGPFPVKSKAFQCEGHMFSLCAVWFLETLWLPPSVHNHACLDHIEGAKLSPGVSLRVNGICVCVVKDWRPVQSVFLIFALQHTHSGEI